VCDDDDDDDVVVVKAVDVDRKERDTRKKNVDDLFMDFIPDR
jgi:hypothetical protein